MTMNYANNVPVNNVVGNNYSVDDSLGFKDEVKHVFESYNGQGVSLSNDMLDVISSPETREEFIANICESLTTSDLFTNSNIANEAFYNNYTDRVEQLLQNSMKSIVTESAMLGYAPIVAYNPFFLKKQWVATVFKDVLMSEIPSNALINIGK